MPRVITHAVIHCSASPNGWDVDAATIDAWHAGRGFQRSPVWASICSPHLRHIGYHYIIANDGTIYPGRHPDEIGAHVQGSNAHSLGICMIGTDLFSQKQWDSLLGLVRGLKHNNPALIVLGHRDFSPDLDGDGVVEPWEWLKTCPGFDVREWLRREGLE